MYPQFETYGAVEALDDQRKLVKSITSEHTVFDVAPPMGMFTLLQSICAFTLSIDRPEEQKLHHVIGDYENRVSQRHIAGLQQSLYTLSSLIGVEIKLKVIQGSNSDGIIIPEPTPTHHSPDVSLVSMTAPDLTSMLFDNTDNLDPNETLKKTVGTILALQSLIEESKNGAFVLMLGGARNHMSFEFFKQSAKAMELIIQSIADINEGKAYTYYCVDK